ncbi:MAG: NAD-dependent epimerase/dehydratase family protein [Gammaproteobacteria bacterium]|nr:NAD-dependent epimerase/dehydratase family protein [Gammaproteobacteria bacterium]
MILVTGGAGFIGSHLVKQLLHKGETVRVLEQPGAKIDHLPSAQLEMVFADIRDANAMIEATKDCSQVYHLAADPNLWRKDVQEFDNINHIGTLNVLRAALDNGVERILYCSTESILTSENANGHSVENLVLKESDMLGSYCLSKFRAEQAAFKMAEEGAPILVVCPTLPVGPGDRRQTPPTRMSVAFCQGKLPAYLECKLNFIDVRDVASGMLAAMERGQIGIRYLLGAENLHLSDWFQVLADETGQNVPKIKVPYTAALAVAWFSECWANRVDGKMPMATVTGVRLTRRSMFFDASASLAALELQPRPIRESATDAVASYREQGWL